MVDSDALLTAYVSVTVYSATQNMLNYVLRSQLRVSLLTSLSFLNGAFIVCSSPFFDVYHSGPCVFSGRKHLTAQHVTKTISNPMVPKIAKETKPTGGSID